MKLMNKKGQIASGMQQLVAIIILVVVAGVVAVAGLDATGTLGADFAAGSAGKNATDDVNQGVQNISGKFPLLGTIAVFSVILIGLAGFLAFRAFGNR